MTSIANKTHEPLSLYPSPGSTLQATPASVTPLTFSYFCSDSSWKIFLQVSKEVKAGSLKTCASAEFHKIIDHISTV